jgi:S-formylglutathione hydrolase FrmB
MSTHDALELAKKHVKDKNHKLNIVSYGSKEAMFDAWIADGTTPGNMHCNPELHKEFYEYYIQHVKQE